MQISLLSGNVQGQMKLNGVDRLLEALEEFLNTAYERPASIGGRYSSPTPLSVSLSLELRSQKEPSSVAGLSLTGNWTPSTSGTQS